MMDTQDDILQKHLELLESGLALDDVLGQVDQDNLQLRRWLILAADMRALPIPELDSAAAGKQDEIVQEYIHSRTHARAGKFSGEKSRWWPWRRWSLVGATAGFFVLIVAVWALFSAKPIREPDLSLTVLQVNGIAEVVSEREQDRGQILQTGDLLTAGQRVRTGAHSQIILKFPDESHLTLAHNTDVAITKLSNETEDGLTVELTQHNGNTRHSVTPRQNLSAAYIVHTPTSDAYVQGTTFSVAVVDNGKAYIAVEEGKVSVRTGSDEVALPAGFATYTQAGQSPTSPVFAFSGHGELRQKNGATWEIDDILIQISDETILDQDIETGDYLSVTGRIIPNGRWVADTIELIQDNEHRVTFTGVVVAITGDLWLVNNTSLLVTDDTEKSADLTQGDLVRGTYTFLNNGRRLALRVDRLSDIPADAEIPSLNSRGSCTGVDEHPESLRLAALYETESSEIMDWFCKGNGFGEIDLAYNLSRQSGIAVTEIFALRATGLGWGEIMQHLGVLPVGPPAGVPEVTEENPQPTGESPGPPSWVTPGSPPITPPAGPPFNPPARPDGPLVNPTGGPPINRPVPPEPPDGPPINPPGPPEDPPDGLPFSVPGPPDPL